MNIVTIIWGYTKWHYSQAIRGMAKIWKNIIVFLFNYFSIALLFRNFFDPWKRMTERKPSFFQTKEYFTASLSNMIMRLLGMVLRTLMLIIGISINVVFVLAFIPTLALWLVLPFVLLAILGLGLKLIIF